MKPQSNHCIELHDSTLSGVVEVGTQIVILLRAYLHQSAGRPGWDAGSGWVQAVALIFTDGRLHGEMPELPADIGKGHLTLAGKELHNRIPIPFSHQGDITLKMWLDPSTDIVISGRRAVLTLLGESVYVEEFAGVDKA